MGRIALLLGGFLLLATPAQAGLMDLLESIESPLLESPELPPLPDEPGEGKNWIGTEIPKPDLPILVLAGHADSQRMAGSGTPGRAVGMGGARPMQPGITDELFWNLLTAKAVVAEGQRQGLKMRFYDPGVRTILDSDDPRTNWSVGREHVSKGGYAVEIHYDAYSPHGIGPGIIPAVLYGFSVMDEALAEEFGAYPYDYRGMLGGPRRGVAMLEIGQLEGALERGLRNPSTRQQTLQTIARRVVRALQQGMVLANSPVGGTTLLKGSITEPVLGPGEDISE